MKNTQIKLWHRFALMMSAIVIIQLFVTGSIVFLLVRSGFRGRMIPVIAIILTAFSISGLITTIVARTFINPIDEVSEAMTKVASGDFSVRLKEKGHSGAFSPVFDPIELMISNFNKMVRELDSTEMLKSDFITNVSHEFKTPLAAIDGYTSLLSATDLNDEQRFYTSNIIESSLRLTTLTGNILKLSKLENQQFNQHKTVFSLDEQIRRSILLQETEWDKKQLNIDPELDSIDFKGFEDLLPQVWTNLIANAIKFTPEGGSIFFDLKKAAGGVSFSIRDTGIGMSEEEQKHAFDKFYQADNNHSVAGNGLGLALVKQIVVMHGGSIKIKSAPNEGSTFTVFLPDNTED